jgi:hypothetical protein
MADLKKALSDSLKNQGGFAGAPYPLNINILPSFDIVPKFLNQLRAPTKIFIFNDLSVIKRIHNPPPLRTYALHSSVLRIMLQRTYAQCREN